VRPRRGPGTKTLIHRPVAAASVSERPPLGATRGGDLDIWRSKLGAGLDPAAGPPYIPAIPEPAGPALSRETPDPPPPPGEFSVRPQEGDRPGAYLCFPFDRGLVERFRASFPRARWRPEAECWFVPGTTAARRLYLWVSREVADLDRHADTKGRDAYAFDPLESPYLEIGADLVVRTPFTRRVVDAMRAIPWARWDPGLRAWRVPFRSYEALRSRWAGIEAAARENEPDRRRARSEARRRSAEARALEAERRRRRYPVPVADPPPLGQPVATDPFGVVVFERVDAESAPDAASLAAYPHAAASGVPLAWARWRMPTWREIAAVKAAPPPASGDRRRGWWPPGAEEIAARRRTMREVERARDTRARARQAPADAPEDGR
jgi:hypothetical protein